MYAAVRTYSGKGARELFDVLEKVMVSRTVLFWVVLFAAAAPAAAKRCRADRAMLL